MTEEIIKECHLWENILPSSIAVQTPKRKIRSTNELARANIVAKNATAMRIFFSILGCVEKDDENYKWYVLSVSDLFVEGEQKLSGSQYEQVDRAIDSLTDLKICFRNTLEEKSRYTSMFPDARIEDGKVYAQISPILKKHVLEGDKYVLFDRLEFLSLRSIYAQRLFVLLKSYDDKPSKIITLEDLHFMLDTPESHRKTFADFKRRVLIPAQKEIITNTGLRYEWDPKKKGRKINAIEFIFSPDMKRLADAADIRNLVSANPELHKKAIDCVRSKIDTIIEETGGGRCPFFAVNRPECMECKKADYVQRMTQQKIAEMQHKLKKKGA